MGCVNANKWKLTMNAVSESSARCEAKQEVGMNYGIKIIKRAERVVRQETMRAKGTPTSVDDRKDGPRLDPATIIKKWIIELRQTKNEEMLAARALKGSYTKT